MGRCFIFFSSFILFNIFIFWTKSIISSMEYYHFMIFIYTSLVITGAQHCCVPVNLLNMASWEMSFQVLWQVQNNYFLTVELLVSYVFQTLYPHKIHSLQKSILRFVYHFKNLFHGNLIALLLWENALYTVMILV